MSPLLLQIVPSIISGAITFAGVVLGLAVASENISRQIRSSHDLQSEQNEFASDQRRREILRQKAEDLLDKFIKVDELKYKAHATEFRLTGKIETLIQIYQEFRFELARNIFSILAIIDMYFPDLKKKTAFNQTNIMMIHGSIANLVMLLKDYDDLVNGRLATPPPDLENATIDLKKNIDRAFQKMQTYLCKAELVDLSKELQAIVAQHCL